MRHAKFNVTQGKNFDRTGSIGPWLIPFTDESQLADIKLETRVNGEVRQSDRTSRMIFSFRKIINYISTFTTLVPGDVIVCGTPTGAGARFDPPIWLKPGDVVEVEPKVSASSATPSKTRHDMLSPEQIEAAAVKLDEAERPASKPPVVARPPRIGMDDAYAIQGAWVKKKIAAGRR